MPCAEMADSRAGPANILNENGAFYNAKNESAQKTNKRMWGYVKRTQSQAEISSQQPKNNYINNIVLDYHPKYKINISKFTHILTYINFWVNK